MASTSFDRSEVKRRTIDIETKAEMVRLFEKGEKVAAIAQKLGYPKSTVSTILKDKVRILSAEKNLEGLKKSCYIRQGPIHEVEKLLVAWIEEQARNQVPLTFLTIQAKACSFFEEIKPKYGSDPEVVFTASPGWFGRFKRRANLNDLNLCKGTPGAYMKICEKYKETLQRVIRIEKYLPEQVFNVDKTSLFWKKLPETTYVFNEAQFMLSLKAYNDRVSLLLGCNAVGYKLKPLLVYHSENPKAFKGISKAALPVHYKINRNCKITREIFDDWFMNCFIPEVHTYCLDMKLPFKILLLLDSTPGYPQYLNDLHPDIRVGFIPPEMTSFVQPMNLGPKSILKANYVRYIFAKAVAAMEKYAQPLGDFWEEYNILDAIANIYAAWQDLSDNCMNAIWKNTLHTSFVKISEEFDKEKDMEDIFKRIVQLAEELHLRLAIENADQLIEAIGAELTNEDLLRVEGEEMAHEDTAEENVGCDKVFRLDDMIVAFGKIQGGLNILKNMDSDSSRFTGVENLVKEALSDYKELFNVKEKQHALMSQQGPH